MTIAFPWGIDESTFDANGLPSCGFDRPQITGPRIPLEECARTIMTPLGKLYWDTQQGVRVPIQWLLNMTPTDADLVRIQTEWSAACVEQVQGVINPTRWAIALNSARKVVKVTGSIALTGVGILPITATPSGSAADIFAFTFPNGLGFVSPVGALPTVPASIP